MTYFATPENVRNEGKLNLAIEDIAIYPHIKKASMEIKNIIGKEQYELLLTYSSSEVTEEKRIYEEIETAENNLSLYYFLPALNIKTGGMGIVKAEGIDQTRQELLSIPEVMQLAKHFRRNAMRILSKYIPEVSQTEDENNNISLYGSLTIYSI